jgi:hypothetical protein
MASRGVGRDAAGPIPGYFDGPFPGEDGGPRRQLVPRTPGLGLRAGEPLVATTRMIAMANMVVLRGPGEVYLQGNTGPGPGNAGFVERLEPTTLEPLARSPDLPAGGVWWPGSIAAHANGSLYVTQGRWCHRLDSACRLIASRELPREAPYNGLLVLADGNLVMKTLVRDGSGPSHLVVLEPEGLALVGSEVAMPEASIARLSKDIDAGGEAVYVVGERHVFRYRYARGRLERDVAWTARYRTRPDSEQSYGWDPVLTGGSAWFMDNGDGVFQASFRGGGVASGPLHLFRVGLDDASDLEELTPFGLARGTIVNPPLVDAARGIVVAYDSGNARLGAFRHAGHGRLEPLWTHDFGAGNHFLHYPDTGEIVVNDHRDDAGEHVVVLDLERGTERGRVAVGSPIQSVLFQAPGFARDVYVCTFATVSRVFVRAA